MGPRMEPCGTPHLIGSEFDVDSLAFMIWDLLVRYDSRSITEEGENCLLPRVCKRSFWLTVSEASGYGSNVAGSSQIQFCFPFL